MASFAVQVVNHTTPAISVGVEDAGGTQGSLSLSPVTYNQLKNSLGQQAYHVNGFYLYSDNINQLTSVIKYSIFDSGGNQDVTNIVTQVDPFQAIPSLLVDLQGYDKSIILNGNSNVGATILPFTTVQLKFLAERVSNGLGMNYTNFEMIQEATNTEFFKDTYGSPLQSIIKTNESIRGNLDIAIETTHDLSITNLLTSREGKPIEVETNGIEYQSVSPFLSKKNKYIVENKPEFPWIWLLIAGGAYLMYKNSKK